LYAWALLSDNTIKTGKLDVFSLPGKSAADLTWDARVGKAKDIGVGSDGSVFMISDAYTDGAVSVAADVIQKYDFSTSKWISEVDFPVNPRKIDVDIHGQCWIINNLGQIWS
jgi:hypothetical protein